MDAAGENARLDRRSIVLRADDLRAIDAARKLASSRRPFGIGADQPGEPRAAAERRDVVGRVARAARHHLCRVVLEDQHRRLAGYARHLAVDELVGDEIADHEHTRAPKPSMSDSSRDSVPRVHAASVDGMACDPSERVEVSIAMSRDCRLRRCPAYRLLTRIQLTASTRLSTTASAVEAVAAVCAPQPARSRCAPACRVRQPAAPGRRRATCRRP